MGTYIEPLPKSLQNLNTNLIKKKKIDQVLHANVNCNSIYTRQLKLLMVNTLKTYKIWNNSVMFYVFPIQSWMSTQFSYFTVMVSGELLFTSRYWLHRLFAQHLLTNKFFCSLRRLFSSIKKVLIQIKTI